MHRIISAIAALILLAACGGPTAMSPLDGLIALNTAARGGKDALEAVQTFATDIQIVEPTFTVDGRYVATRDGRMRIDILLNGERVFTEALDRDGGWSWSPDGGVKVTTAQGATALRRGIEFPFKLFGLHDMRARGHRLEIAGRERIGAIDYHVLTLTLDDGFQTRYYLNPDSGLIERERQFRAMHVDVDPNPLWIETEFLDYRPVGGVLFPHSQIERRLESGELLSTTIVSTIRLNTAPGADHFRQPR